MDNYYKRMIQVTWRCKYTETMTHLRPALTGFIQVLFVTLTTCFIASNRPDLATASFLRNSAYVDNECTGCTWLLVDKNMLHFRSYDGERLLDIGLSGVVRGML